MEEKKKMNYAWIILIACCMMTMSMGLSVYVCGQYFVSVTTELGVGLTELSLFITIMSLVMAFTSPIVGRTLSKAAKPYLYIAGGVALVALSIAAMSLYHHVWGWYISGALMGIGGAFCFVIPVPIILGNWFKQRLGFAIGIAMAAAGVGGMIMNPVIASLVADVGWRTTYLINALIIAAVVLPFPLFIIRTKPADKGMQPYGYDAKAAAADATGGAAVPTLSGVPAKTAIKSLPFVLMFITFGLSGFLTGFANFLLSFASSLGFGAAVAGSIASMNSLGNMGSKVIFGAVNDKFGPKVLTIFGYGLIVVAFVLLIMNRGLAAIILIGACLLGCANGMGSVANPLYVRTIFGPKDYATIFSNLQMGMSLIAAFASPVIGFIFDRTGSFSGTFIVGIVLVAVLIVLILTSLTLGKKLPREN